jgi:hypothetical protein
MLKHASAVAAAIATSFLVATAAHATDAPLQMTYPTDGGLTCEGLTTEIARMDSLMGISQQNIGSANGQATAANLGASAAINGALYSGALGRVPGLGMFANRAASMAQQNAAAKVKAQEEQIRVAEGRKAMLSGIYMGKNCAAMTTASAATTAPAAVVVPAAGPAPAR